MLIDPEPLAAKGRLPLIRAAETFENLPIEQLEAIGDALCAAQEASEFPEFSGPMRARLKQAGEDGDLHIQVVLVALANGELRLCRCVHRLIARTL